MKNILVTGAGGFIGSHLVRYLKQIEPDSYIIGVDLHKPKWTPSAADTFIKCDLREYNQVRYIISHAVKFDEVYHLAADMGGMGFITTQQPDIMRNNTLINTNVLEACVNFKVGRLFFSSSVCIYPTNKLDTPYPPPLREEDAYPALPQESYGWEKLHMEHLCYYYREGGWLDTRVARFENCYGTDTEWRGGREKAPAALARKVAVAKLTGKNSIRIWGDGQATRGFMHVSDCVRGIVAIMRGEHIAPAVTLGAEEVVTVDELANILMDAAGVEFEKVHTPGPQGVRGRAFNHERIHSLGWTAQMPLTVGMAELYHWVEAQVKTALDKGEAIE